MMPRKSKQSLAAALLSVLCHCLLFSGYLSGPAHAQTSDDALLLMVPVIAANARPSAKGVIGAAGGVLAVDTVSVQVPAGAFSSVTELSLTGQSSKPDFLGAPQSLIWKLRVDAEGWNKALTICLGQVGGSDREMPVALAESLVVDADRSDSRPAIVTGRVVAGKLYVDIAPNDGESGAGAGMSNGEKQNVPTHREATFWRITGFETLRSDHFRLYYPASIAAYPEDIPQQILNFAELARTKLTAMGFSANRLQTPVNITVEKGMGDTDGEAGVPLSGKAGQYMNINFNICTPDKLERLKVTVGHEYFHIIQNLYNPRSGLAIRHPWSTPNFLMLSEASSVWFEGVMLDSGSYVSQVFINALPEFNHGLGVGAKRGDIQNLGYWASGFLRYLRDRRGSNSFVYDLWRAVQDQGTGSSGLSDLGALIDTVGSMATISSNWTDFLEKTASRNTGYANWQPLPGSRTHYLENENGDYTPYAIFVDDIEPFSGRVWRVVLNKLESGDTNWVAVSEEAPEITYALYKATGGSGGFARLGPLIPRKPIHFTASLKDIIVAVASNGDSTHPYRQAQTASVQIKVQGEPQYCLNVPPGWPMEINSHTRIWTHLTKGYRVAEETYRDAACTDPSHVLCYDIEYGYPNMKIEWYENGKKKVHYHMNEDYILHGKYQSWFENGQLEKEFTYVNGSKQGLYTEYFEDGTLRTKGNYCAGGYGIGLWYVYREGYGPECLNFPTCGGDPVYVDCAE
ncbi:toxin-antitoxin system YwqK family antitoxin [Desulfolutivibrio sp.]|uniref:toxin-antitoxin system YwqK family antitoxin n=1 Tax=Desulfolutivibrio sp. TaxID=2773296 RepID=UPI002F96749D